jgi:hypothetical protein
MTVSVSSTKGSDKALPSVPSFRRCACDSLSEDRPAPIYLRLWQKELYFEVPNTTEY